MTALAREFGIHRSSVYKHLEREGVPLRQSGLPTQHVNEAAALYAVGWTLAQLAEKYEVAGTTIGGALRRASLTHAKVTGTAAVSHRCCESSVRLQRDSSNLIPLADLDNQPGWGRAVRGLWTLKPRVVVARLWKSSGVLAYVFWHSPATIDPHIATYEAALAAFHRSLDPAEIAGFRGSRAFVVHGAVWVSSSVVYEDWYLVDDFTALGELNAAAVSAHRQRPHDNVAGMAGEGMAGIYALRQGVAQLSDTHRAAWFSKPADVSYDEFFRQLGGRGSLWQRQMVLGPTPEFCSLDDTNPPRGAVTVARVREVGGSAS